MYTSNVTITSTNKTSSNIPVRICVCKPVSEQKVVWIIVRRPINALATTSIDRTLQLSGYQSCAVFGNPRHFDSRSRGWTQWQEDFADSMLGKLQKRVEQSAQHYLRRFLKCTSTLVVLVLVLVVLLLLPPPPLRPIWFFGLRLFIIKSEIMSLT
jgi:hypothetical protein